MGPWGSGLSATVSASQISIFNVTSSCRKLWIVPEIEYQHDTNTVGGVEITRGVGLGDGLCVGTGEGAVVGVGASVGVGVGEGVGIGVCVGVGVGGGGGVGSGSSDSDFELFCSLDSFMLSV